MGRSMTAATIAGVNDSVGAAAIDDGVAIAGCGFADGADFMVVGSGAGSGAGSAASPRIAAITVRIAAASMGAWVGGAGAGNGDGDGDALAGVVEDCGGTIVGAVALSKGAIATWICCGKDDVGLGVFAGGV